MECTKLSYGKHFLGAFAIKLPIISQFSKIQGAVICNDLGTEKSKMNKHSKELKVNLEQVVPLF